MYYFLDNNAIVHRRPIWEDIFMKYQNKTDENEDKVIKDDFVLYAISQLPSMSDEEIKDVFEKELKCQLKMSVFKQMESLVLRDKKSYDKWHACLKKEFKQLRDVYKISPALIKRYMMILEKNINTRGVMDIIQESNLQQLLKKRASLKLWFLKECNLTLPCCDT